MVVGTAILGLALIWVASNIIALFKNYRVARQCGLPIVVTPANPDNIIWMIFCQMIRPRLKSVLPESVWHYFTPTIYGWEFLDKYHFHHSVGKTFLLVTPGDVECWTADPAVANAVLARWKKDFPTLPLTATIIGFCGPNLLTVSLNLGGRNTSE
jgi:hypothetical protein